MRILFLGTPDFAVPTLKELIASDGFDVVGVVTQPDRPAGRGNKLQAPPTKVLAVEHGIPVFQPVSLSKSPEIVAQLKELQPDYTVMVAFGQILRKSMLEMPRNGVVNIHASLLPKYRGAAPINWAIINGESVSGITTMFTEAGVDTGPILLKHEVDIAAEMTAEDLATELSHVGAKLVIETILKLESGELQPEVQDHTQASLAPMLSKDMGKIDWSLPALTIHNLVRGLYPWPGTFTKYGDTALKVLKTSPAGTTSQSKVVGEILVADSKILVACGAEGQDRLELVSVQPANKGRMSARDWANGVRIHPGDVLVS